MATSKSSSTSSSTDTTSSDTSANQTSNSRLDNPGYSDILTAKDALGTERVVTVADNSWEPAPIDPSDEAVAAAEERVKREEANREERLARLGIGKDGIDESKVGKDVNTGSTGDPTTTNDAAAQNQTPGESTVNQDSTKAAK